jgi:hypothetical protein
MASNTYIHQYTTNYSIILLLNTLEINRTHMQIESKQIRVAKTDCKLKTAIKDFSKADSREH